MSDGEFHAYIALLAFSGLLLSVIAIRGFGMSMPARVMDGIASVGFLGYAVYLVVADPAEFWIFYYAFAVPIWAVIHVRRARKETRAARFASYAMTPAGFAPMGAPSQQHAAVGAGYGYDGAFPAQPAPSATGYQYPGASPGEPASPAADQPYTDSAAPVASYSSYSSYQDLPSGLHPAVGGYEAHPVTGPEQSAPGQWSPYGA